MTTPEQGSAAVSDLFNLSSGSSTTAVLPADLIMKPRTQPMEKKAVEKVLKK
jgi:hypothetical protein